MTLTKKKRPVKDPTARKDGRCYMCGKEKVIPAPTQKNLLMMYEREARNDPFCSTKCCREYYGTLEDSNQPLSRDMSQEK